MAEAEEHETPVEDLPPEDRLKILEKSSRKRLFMIYGLITISVMLLFGQLGGLILLSFRIADIETVQSTPLNDNSEFKSISQKLSDLEVLAFDTEEQLSRFDMTKSDGKLRLLAEVMLQHELNRQDELQRLANSMLRLSRMVRGSREWHEDVKEDLNILLRGSKEIEEKLYQILPDKKPAKPRESQPSPEAIEDLELSLELSSF